MVDLVDKWKKESGEEWTVSRLKAMKVTLLKSWAGEEISQDHWISLHNDGSFRGPFRCLFGARTVKARARAVNTLMAYTGFTAIAPTPKQWAKFSTSVEKISSVDVDRGLAALMGNRHVADDVANQGQRWLTGNIKPRPVVLEEFRASPRKRAPYWELHPGKLRTAPEDRIDLWGLTSLWTPLRLIESRDLGGAFEGLIADMRGAKPFLVGMQVENDSLPSWMGKVSFIQEPGYKLRAVANPNRWVQLALEPLKDRLSTCLKRVSRDCTFDQDKGVERVKRWLSEGRTVHSVDLSDATNHFPLTPQLEMLRAGLGKDWEPWIDLWHCAAVGHWRVEDPLKGCQREMRWEAGQPLGLGPSFFAFSLAHHALATVSLREKDDDYVMLGDDIAIVGDGAAEAYRGHLETLQCPISKDKSITSSRIAEFAGKVVFADAVVPVAKWRDLSDRNFLDLCRVLGPQFKGALRPRQVAVMTAISEIPEQFGGLGWNPDGVSFEERVERNLSTIRKLEGKETTPYQRSAGRLSSLWRSATVVGNPDIPSELPDLGSTDPISELTRREAIISSSGIIREEFREEESVPTGWTSADPLGGDPRGPSTLDVLERKLRTGITKAEMLRRSAPRKAKKPPTVDPDLGPNR
jgi:hypothetical protein